MTNDTEHYRADPYVDDDLVPFDARDYSDRRAMRLLLVSVGLLLLLAFLLFKLYYQGTRDRSAPPRINADATPYKVEPENPGGAITPNQDKAVYDVMNGTASTGTVETQPIEEPIQVPDKATIVIAGEEPVEQVEPQDPVREIPAPRPAAPDIPAAVDGNFVVQIASVRSREDAERIWSEMGNKFSDVLPIGSYADIKRADLGDKGIYYRLRVAGLDDKTAASRLCDRFKARNQACFVARK